MERFVGKTVLVTGASSGLGRSCAMRLGKEGANLILVSRRKVALDELSTRTSRAISCDLANESQVRDLISELKREAQPIDGWVMAAGVQRVSPLMMVSMGGMRSMWEVNVYGSFGLLGAALKARMIAAGGSIVLFSSAVATTGAAAMVAYSASKGAIEGGMRSLAAELAGRRIRVNAIAPGVVHTAMSEDHLSKLTVEQVARITERHLLGLGQPDDIAGPVAFLLSDEARWITGSVITVDGGYSLG